MIPILFLLLQPSAACLRTPPAPAHFQEPVSSQGKKEKQAPRRFPRLSPTLKKKAGEALVSLWRAKKADDVARARDTLIQAGPAVVPLCLGYFPHLAEKNAERVPELRAVLDKILAEKDLDLAWKAAGKKTGLLAKLYLARRTAESGRKDAARLLEPLLKETEPGLVYEAARGLAWRGSRPALVPLRDYLRGHWTRDHDRIRRDFEGFPRGPLSGPALPLLRAKDPQDREAGLHLFELVGIRAHARSLEQALLDTDNQIRLAGINACRVVVDGKPPDDTLSVFQIISKAEAWIQRLKAL
ncbi:MAG: hypothetical protein ACE5H3_00045 [Planctomycetota bacterium]